MRLALFIASRIPPREVLNAKAAEPGGGSRCGGRGHTEARP